MLEYWGCCKEHSCSTQELVGPRGLDLQVARLLIIEIRLIYSAKRTICEGIVMPLKEKIFELIKGPKLAALATVDEESGQVFPAVRYVVVTGMDDLSLVAFTSKKSRKISQIERNSNVALTIRTEGDYTTPYAIIKARSEIHEDPEIKRKFWGPHLEKNVKNPEDPRYVALRFIPLEIEYYSQGRVEVWRREAS
jgi:general stress protein 26